MVFVGGVHLLPATGEFAYDTIPAQGAQRVAAGLGPLLPMNCFYAPGGSKTDYSYALDQLQAAHPECTTVSLVVAWFFNSENAASCNIYPSTNYLLGEFERLVGGVWTPSHWMVSSLTEADYPGVIPLPALRGTTNFVYGGTPSDPSIVRCIQDLKSRGFKVVFYPFLLGTGSGFPWRGRITYSPDISSAATSAVNAFLGSAAVGQFTQDAVNLTVAYSGYLYDWTYRRMILHYANLCCVAGGVNLFVIGSELRGLETIRGPAWADAGTTDGSGYAIWDYPFVGGLVQLAADVRTTFNNSGYTKNLSTLQNLITYSADWSSWMGYQHPGANGQWPHLDSLWASSNIDIVCFDNYLPLTDWTTGNGGVDATEFWTAPAYTGAWPPPSSSMSNLGLSGVPTIYSSDYLTGNIEGGQYFDWYYNDGANDGRGFDPNGSGLQVSLCEGDRLAQARNAYSANQQILANKQLRWWWNNTHQAVYIGGGGGWIPQGPQTEWQAQSKSIAMLEYGFAAFDKSTNQPNVFFDAKSTESATAYWSIWDNAGGLGYLPRRDDTIQSLALQALYTYWVTNGNIPTSGGGVAMINWNFCCVWNWDARPFPTFPADPSQWGDTGNWQAGDWNAPAGSRIQLVPPAPTPPPSPGTYQSFPVLSVLGWSAHVRPKFSTLEAQHVSGRSSRKAQRAFAYFDIELTYEVLRSDALDLELQTIAGFFAQMQGQATPFWVSPPGIAGLLAQPLGTGNGTQTVFPLMRTVGGYSEAVQGASSVSAVYLNGVAQPGTGWSVSSGYAPAITFTTAPGLGVAVTADFGFLWLCRFAEDVQDFEEFMAMLWTLKTLRLSMVRP